MSITTDIWFVVTGSGVHVLILDRHEHHCIASFRAAGWKAALHWLNHAVMYPSRIYVITR